MIFYEQPTDPWTPYDFKLLEAYQILQDETCPTCGNPIWICRTTNSDVVFKMRKTTCFAEREEKRWHAEKEKRFKPVKGGPQHWEPEPGDQWFPVAETISGEPLPGRDAYYKEMAESER